jgi:hypothetical protein
MSDTITLGILGNLHHMDCYIMKFAKHMAAMSVIIIALKVRHTVTGVLNPKNQYIIY